MEEVASFLQYINYDICSDEHPEPRSFSYHGIRCVLEGYGILKIKDRTFPITAGQSFYIPRGISAAYWSRSPGGMKYVWLNFDEWALFSEIMAKTAFTPETPVCQTTKEQEKLFKNLLSQKQKLLHGNHYQIMAMILWILSSYIDSFPAVTRSQDETSFQNLLTFINNNLLRKDLNTEMLIRVSGQSRASLFGHFKKEVNCSPGEYIRRKRMVKARNMLYTTNFSIQQIADLLGYNDPLYFSRLFRAETGVSPTRYRKEMAKSTPN